MTNKREQRVTNKPEQHIEKSEVFHHIALAHKKLGDFLKALAIYEENLSTYDPGLKH